MMLYKRTTMGFTLGVLLVVAGCGGKPGAATGTQPKAGNQAASTPTPQGLMSADPASPAPPPPPPGQAPAAVTVMPASGDDVAFYRPTDKLGNVATDLEVLNSALMAYGTDGVERPPFRDLSDLVKAGLLKKLPTAPPGKKYVFDPKLGQAKLENR